MKVKFLGETSERSLKGKMKLVASAAKLSHFAGNMSQLMTASRDHEENLKVIRRITRSGHKSVMEHHYINLGLSEVTPIIEQILIGFRLTAFTIKSRRYVDFRRVGFYVPEFKNPDGTIHIDNEFLQRKYKRHMNSLFKFYSEMVDGGIIKEDARFILPYCFYSEIAMSLNAREFEKMTEYLLFGEYSKIQEVHDLGEAFLEIARQHVPEIVEYIENYKSHESDFDYRAILIEQQNYVDILDKPRLLYHTPNIDNLILETAVMGEMQCSMNDASKLLHKAEMNDKYFRNHMMDAIVKKNENRELEQVSFTWQIPISLSILTHLTRHRMHSLLVPNFNPLWNFENYIIPDTIKYSDFVNRYETIIAKNKSMMEAFKKAGVREEDLVYFYLGCQMCNVTTTMNGRELMWITRMRSCNRAQWQMRHISDSMIEQVYKIAPLYAQGLGATCKVYRYCPEGKLSCGLIQKILESKINE